MTDHSNLENCSRPAGVGRKDTRDLNAVPSDSSHDPGTPPSGTPPGSPPPRDAAREEPGNQHAAGGIPVVHGGNRAANVHPAGARLLVGGRLGFLFSIPSAPHPPSLQILPTQRNSPSTSPAPSLSPHAVLSRQTSSQGRRALLQQIAVFSPGSRKLVLSLLSGTSSKNSQPTHPSSETKLRMESKGSLFSTKTEPHPAVLDLLANRHHVPLSLCTNEAIQSMYAHPEKVKYMGIHDANGTKKNLLDVSTWGAEENLSIEDWRDAWKNFLIVVEKMFEQKVLILFQDHFDFLCNSRHFKRSFETVLTFDIDIRRRFFAGQYLPFAVGELSYVEELNGMSFEVIDRNRASSSSSQSRSA